MKDLDALEKFNRNNVDALLKFPVETSEALEDTTNCNGILENRFNRNNVLKEVFIGTLQCQKEALKTNQHRMSIIMFLVFRSRRRRKNLCIEL